MRERIYLGRLEELIKNYQFNLPLSIYLRQEFHKRRNMGSRDRRRTREDIFNYFRIGKNFSDMSIAERIAIGSFICSKEQNPETDYILSTHSVFQTADLGLSLESKLEKIKGEFPDFELNKIFPFTNLLSPKIDKEKFLSSFFQQPKLFIRVRRKFREDLLSELAEKKINYTNSEEEPFSFSFANSTPVHELGAYHKGFFEIQDINSQRSANWFQVNPQERWWDACCGSGGKTLALLDKEPDIHLIASDLRESSLKNFESRLSKAGLKVEKVHPLDLSDNNHQYDNVFDGIIADVPCSGSGTWARSPEILSSFSENSIFDKYVPLQRKIIRNLTNALKPGKQLIYITCSVFNSENEENITHFVENFGLKCISFKYFEGSEIGADTMFAAILEKE